MIYIVSTELFEMNYFPFKLLFTLSFADEVQFTMVWERSRWVYTTYHIIIVVNSHNKYSGKTSLSKLFYLYALVINSNVKHANALFDSK